MLSCMHRLNLIFFLIFAFVTFFRLFEEIGCLSDCKFLTMSTEFDKNSSKWSYSSTDYQNCIKIFFEHFPSKLLDPQKSTFGNVILGIKLFFKWSYQKIVFTKDGLLNWYSPMKIFFRKIRIIFDIKKWLWKSEFCNLVGLITSTKNVQKCFQSHFCDQWSISFSLKSFYQILLTWSKYYDWNSDCISCRILNLVKIDFNRWNFRG
jgi:hypothetical protein